MAKTTKEIADELGIDKQIVYRYIKKNHINEAHHEALQNGGVKRYDEAAESLIKQGLSQKSTSSEAHHEVLQNRINDAVSEAVIELLRKELEIKNKQIEQQAQTITRLTDALAAAQQTAQAAQALHAGTMQQQLNAAAADEDMDPATAKEETVIEPRSDEHAEPKKKRWQFWK